MKSVKKVKNGKLLKALLVLAIVVGLSIAIPVAAAPDTATIPPEAKSMINSIVGLLQWMMYLVGGGLILFGGFTALMGWYQERPDDAASVLKPLAASSGRS